MSAQENPPPSMETSLFEDWPEDKVEYPPKDSRQLALAIRNSTTDSAERLGYQQHGIRMIRFYLSEFVASEDDLNEILPLSLAQDRQISELLLIALQEKIPKDMTDPRVAENYLFALNTIVSNILKSHLNEKMFYAVVDMLLDNFSPFLLQQDVEANLIDWSISILNGLYFSGMKVRSERERYDKVGDNETKDLVLMARFLKYHDFKANFNKSWDCENVANKDLHEESSKEIQVLQAKCYLFFELLKRLIGDHEESETSQSNLQSLPDFEKLSLGIFNSMPGSGGLDLQISQAGLDWFQDYFRFRLCLALDQENSTKHFDRSSSIVWKEFTTIKAFSMIESIKECFHKTKKKSKRKDLWSLLDPLNYGSLHHLGSPFRAYMASTRYEMLKSKFKGDFDNGRVFQACKIEAGSVRDVTLRIKEATGACKDLKTLHKQYVPFRAFLSKTRERYDAFQMIKEFCDPKNEARVLLLVGDSGSGKTLLQQYATYELWNDFKFRVDSIPLYVSLKSLEDPWKNAIYETLYSPIKNGMDCTEHMRFSKDNIEELRDDKFPVIFFMDDFDDIEFKFASIYESNKFAEWPNAKFVISCQKQFTDRYEDYLSMFSPQSRDKNPDLIEEMQLLPFSKEERNRYFTNYIQQTEGIKWKDAVDMEKAFSSIPNLVQLAASPLILALATEMLPKLTEEYEKTKLVKEKDSEPMEITKTALYRKYTSHFFEKQKGKATKLENHFPSEVKENFGSYLQEFCKELAYRLLAHSKSMTLSSVSPRHSISSKMQPTIDGLFKHASWVKYIKHAAPLKFMHESRMEFSSNSLRDYFLSEYIWDSFNRSSENPSNLKDPKKFCFASPIPLEESLAHQMNTSVLMNLSEYVIQNTQFKDSLFKIVSYSKGKNAELVDETIAAANAITILNYAGVSFTKNTDFQGISIPGADLSCSVLDEADFTDANLYNVNFSYAHLGSCNFNKCKMERTQFSKAASPRGHSDIVTSVCLVKSNNEKLALASASRDKSIRIWDLDTGSQIHILRKHTDSVNCICSVKGPEGESWLASGGADQMLHIWNAKTGLHVMELKGHVGSISAICQLKSTKKECWVATGGDDCVIRIWDLIKNTEIGVLKGHSSSVNVLLMLENDFITTLPGSGAAIPLLASGSSDFSIKIWDIATCEVILTLCGHTGSITSIANIEMKSGQKCLVSASNDKTIRIWDTRSGIELKTITVHSESVNFVCKFKRGGDDCLASVSDDKTIRIWESGLFSEAQKFDRRQVTFQPGPSGTYSTEGNVILCIRNNTSFEVASLTDVAGAMQFTSLDRVMNIQTKFIIGPRKLEGGDIQLVNVEGLTKVTKSNLLSLGAVSFDAEFKEYCNSKNYTAFQAKNMGYAYENDLFQKIMKTEGKSGQQTQTELSQRPNYRKAIEWYGKAFDFDSLKRLGMEEIDGALAELRKLAKEICPDGTRKHAEASIKMIRCYQGKLSSEKLYQNKQSIAIKLIKWHRRSLDYAWLMSVARKDYSVIGLIRDGDNQSKLDYNKRAFNAFLQLAKKRNNEGLIYPKAALHTAECYENGWGCPPNLHKAVEWYSKVFAFEQLRRIAQSKHKGEVEKTIQSVAFSQLRCFAEETYDSARVGDKIAAQVRYPNAASNLAKCYENGFGTDINLSKAVEWYGKALDFDSLRKLIQKDPQGLDEGGAEAIKELEKLGQGRFGNHMVRHRNAAKLLSELYETGAGHVTTDLLKSAEWKRTYYNIDMLMACAERGITVSLYVLSELAEENYSNGMLKFPDIGRFISTCFEEGYGVDSNLELALQWTSKDHDLELLKDYAKNGFIEAFMRLKRIADDEKYPDKVKRLFARTIVAECYEEGWGTHKDLDKVNTYKQDRGIYDPSAGAGKMSPNEKTRALPNPKINEKENSPRDEQTKHDGQTDGRSSKSWVDEQSAELYASTNRKFERYKNQAIAGDSSAVEILKRYANDMENGITKYPAAARILSDCYTEGWGVQKNIEEATRWSLQESARKLDYLELKRHAQKGNNDAMVFLTRLAKPVKDGEIKDLEAAYYVSLCYSEGWSVPVDCKKSGEWMAEILKERRDYESLKIYAQNGSSNAFGLLKSLAPISPVVGGKKDRQEKWYTETVRIIAECYTNAWGVKKNPTEAAVYYEEIQDFKGLRHLASLGCETAFEKLKMFASARHIYGLSKYPEAVRFARECRRRGWGVPKKPSFLSLIKMS